MHKTSQTSFRKDKIKILLAEGINRSALDVFKQHGYTNIDHITHALDETELLSLINQYHFIGIRSRTLVTKKVLKKAKKLNAIGCYCIGTNQVELSAAAKLGIPVFHAPYSNTRSVAELVIGKIIFLMRNIPQKNAAAHQGKWLKSHLGAYEVRGKTLGIIGYGNIGNQVGLLAESLGMHVMYYDVRERLPLSNAKAALTMNEVLETADVVTLHVPETEQTKHLIGLKQLQRMKKHAALINTSRGTVVVIEALAEALSSGHLRGAALDVFPEEPTGESEEFISPLRDFDNVILTPHIGGSTHEAQDDIGKTVSKKMITFSDTGNTFSAVNFPEVDLPAFTGKHRILHIHKNEPGVLSNINDVFSDLGINIAAQYLQTSQYIGYVVTDLDSKGNKANILQSLQAIPGTIKTRILY